MNEERVPDEAGKDTTSRRVRTSALWLIVERGVTLAMGLTAALMVVRHLGPATFGTLSYAASLIALFGAFSTLGIPSVVIRHLAEETHDVSALLSTSYVLRALGGLLGASLALASAVVLDESRLAITLVALGGGGLVFAVGGVPDLWFKAQVQSKYPAIIRSVFSLLRSGMVVAVVLAGGSAVVIVSIAPLVSVPIGLTFFWVLRRSLPTPFRWSPSMSLAKEILSESWPLLLSGLSIAIYMSIDQVMLNALTNEREVGLYASAVRLSETTYFVPMMLGGLALPVLTRLRASGSPDKYEAAVQTFYDAMVLLAYLIALPLTFFAEEIVVLLMGDEFADAAPMLRVHAWAFVFVSLGVARSQWLVIERLTRFALMATLLGAVVNVGLNWVFLERYGGVGAAWTTVVAQAVSAYLSSLLLPTTRGAFTQASRSLVVPFRAGNVFRAYRSSRGGRQEVS